MKNKILLLTLILSPAAKASTGLIEVPKSYKAVLDCKAVKGSPHFIVARKNKTYYLLTNQFDVTKVIELYDENADMGFAEYQPENPKDLIGIMDNFSSLYIYNNGEEIEDTADAVISSGMITFQNNEKKQNCKVLGKFKVEL